MGGGRQYTLISAKRPRSDGKLKAKTKERKSTKIYFKKETKKNEEHLRRNERNVEIDGGKNTSKQKKRTIKD